jgi:hypothetical protein
MFWKKVVFFPQGAHIDFEKWCFSLKGRSSIAPPT